MCLVWPYGLVMPAPVGVVSVKGGVPLPYTVALDEKTASGQGSRRVGGKA
jgi:hypothetical protein